MRELYNNEYVNTYSKKLKNYKTSYLIIAIFSILAIAGILVYYAFEPYGTSLRIPLLVALILIIVSFVTYSFVHFGYTYGVVKKYYEFLVYTVCGKRSVSKVTVLSVLYEPVDKNGFDCYRLVVLEWSSTTDDYVEHTIYIDSQVTVTDLKEGDIVSISTNSNYLLAYKKETV